MNWSPPLKRTWLLSSDSMMFQRLTPEQCEIPVGPHLAAFGVERAHHMHEGMDFYGQDGEDVFAVEKGVIVAIEEFTGPQVGSPWWNQTWSVLVEGETGVVVYGEIIPDAHIKVGEMVGMGQLIGQIRQVLTKNKGRPMSMLHLELHHHGTRKSSEWKVGEPIPETLRDPTPYCRPWINLEPHRQTKVLVLR